MSADYFVVVRLPDDTKGTDKEGIGYVLASRRIFSQERTAVGFAKSLAASRKPLVISGRFHELKVGK